MSTANLENLEALKINGVAEEQFSSYNSRNPINNPSNKSSDRKYTTKMHKEEDGDVEMASMPKHEAVP
jgi:hypothetical protein